MNISEGDVKDFICMVGTKIAVTEVAENTQVTYTYGGFRDSQSISILREEIATNDFGEVESILSENYFVSVKAGELLELPNKPRLDNAAMNIYEVVTVYPERNSIQLIERITTPT